MKKCSFDKQYNKCQYLDTDQICKSDKPCSMELKELVDRSTKAYKREPRWYEKYYGPDRNKINKNVQHIDINKNIEFK